MFIDFYTPSKNRTLRLIKKGFIPRIYEKKRNGEWLIEFARCKQLRNDSKDFLELTALVLGRANAYLTYQMRRRK